MPQPYFMLIIEPRLIKGSRAEIDDPADKPRLDSRLVGIIRLAIGIKKPARQMLLCTDDRAPAINQLFRVRFENPASLAERSAIVVGKSNRRFQLPQFIERDRRRRRAPVIVTFDFRFSFEHEKPRL